MNLTLVPNTHVDQVWPIVKPMLEKALDRDNPVVTIDQLRMMVVNGRQELVTIDDGEKVVGAITIEFCNYPNRRIALGTAFGGRGIATHEIMDKLKRWCKHMGASEFRTYAKDPQARLYRRLGMEKLYNAVGVQL